MEAFFRITIKIFESKWLCINWVSCNLNVILKYTSVIILNSSFIKYTANGSRFISLSLHIHSTDPKYPMIWRNMHVSYQIDKTRNLFLRSSFITILVLEKDLNINFTFLRLYIWNLLSQTFTFIIDVNLFR